MTDAPSKPGCYPVECCAECQGRLPMRHLYKPYGMMSHHNIVDVDSEFANRWVCTETDDNREIKLHPSLDFPDWCPLKVIPDGLDITARQQEIFDVLEQLVFALHCYEQEVLDPDFPAPSKHRNMMQQAENLLAQIKTKESWFERHDAAIRNAVLDELGILHGEDAKRFNEQLDHPEPLTPEARDLVMRAKEIAQATRKEKGCPYWNPDVNIYPDEPGNHCTCQFSHIRKNEREKVLDKIVLMTLDRPCTEDYSPNLLGCSGCPFAISYDNGEDCVIRSLRSAATPTVSNKGDINGS